MGDALDFHVASRSDVHGAAQSLGQFAEDQGHLCRRLEIELIRRKLHAVRIAHSLAGLNAEQDVLRVGVFVMDVVAIVRGYQRNSGFFRQAHQFAVYAFLDLEALILNLKKEIAFSKNVAQSVCVFARLVVLFLGHRFRDRPAQAGG